MPDKETISIHDEERLTAKKVREYQDLKEMKDRFNEVWQRAEENKRFSDYCYQQGLKREHQMYLVSGLIDGGAWTQTDRCRVLGIQFNRKGHRHYHDDSRNADVISFAKTSLDMSKPKGERSLTKVLEAIIHGEARPTDKVKAIESLVKLQEKEQGSSMLKPWEKMWNTSIIPKLHAIYCDTNELDED